MKIAVASDVHLEFGPLELVNTHGADVLILGGDICIARDLGDRDVHNLLGEHTKSHRYHQFFESCAARFTHVIYIAGNHEHYHGDYAITVPRLKEKLSYLKNLHVMEKESITLDDVTFVCGTLWTDMNREDPETLFGVRGVINDFRIIRYGDHKFLPQDTVDDHKAMLTVIRDTVSANPVGRFVVVGHHSPSRLSTHPRYRDEGMVNGAYSSDLSELMLDHPQIRLWTHGHTHHEFDYMIGSCRVVCNPRGYIGYEDQASTWQLKTVEV